MKKLSAIIIFIVLSISPFCAFAEDASLQSAVMKVLSLHEQKRPPGPMDWLARHPEKPQSFEVYIQSNPVKPDTERKYIYIALIGDFDEQRLTMIQKTAQFMEVYFATEVKFIDPIAADQIPASAKRIHPQTQDEQILSTYVIEEVLIPRKPQDAFCLIAFSVSDLWPGDGWNFVFGQASMEDRVGVWSIYRNGDPYKSEEDYRLSLLRTLKTGIHEVGHMYSLPHCVFYECLMNGTNHLQERDQRPLWLCPLDLMKLGYNVKFDLLERYQQLEKLSREFGLLKEAEFYEKSIRLIQPSR